MGWKPSPSPKTQSPCFSTPPSSLQSVSVTTTDTCKDCSHGLETASRAPALSPGQSCPLRSESSSMVSVTVLVELTLTEVKKMTCPSPEEWQPWGPTWLCVFQTRVMELQTDSDPKRVSPFYPAHFRKKALKRRGSHRSLAS